MPADPQLEKARSLRMRTAERKLKEAQQRLARTERSIAYWSRILADLKHRQTRAVQPPLWPEEETNEEN
ncbi:MAG: hypothetical protein P4K94_01410 [Terracidiphilus sp.]|nr:hypothetical protein [Terracidiphilus sp.]